MTMDEWKKPCRKTHHIALYVGKYSGAVWSICQIPSSIRYLDSYSTTNSKVWWNTIFFNAKHLGHQIRGSRYQMLAEMAQWKRYVFRSWVSKNSLGIFNQPTNVTFWLRDTSFIHQVNCIKTVFKFFKHVVEKLAQHIIKCPINTFC